MENGMTKILELIKKEAHSLFFCSKHGKTDVQETVRITGYIMIK